MAYMASNEPYGRVDDGIGAGVVMGSILGGAAGMGASGSAIMNAGRQYSNQFGEAEATERLNNARQQGAADYAKSTGRETGIRSKAAGERSAINEMNREMNTKSSRFANATAGSGRNQLIAAGVSMAAGGVLGGLIDSANK